MPLPNPFNPMHPYNPLDPLNKINNPNTTTTKRTTTPLSATSKNDLYGSYYTYSNNKIVKIGLYRSRVWDDDTKKFKFLKREDEPSLKFKTEYIGLDKVKEKEKKKLWKRILK